MRLSAKSVTKIIICLMLVCDQMCACASNIIYEAQYTCVIYHMNVITKDFFCSGYGFHGIRRAAADSFYFGQSDKCGKIYSPVFLSLPRMFGYDRYFFNIILFFQLLVSGIRHKLTQRQSAI